MVLHARVCGRVGRRPIKRKAPAGANRVRGFFVFAVRYVDCISEYAEPLRRTEFAVVSTHISPKGHKRAPQHLADRPLSPTAEESEKALWSSAAATANRVNHVREKSLMLL